MPELAATLPVIPASEWRRAALAHEERAAALIGSAKSRRARGQPHPVEDFLHTYYRFSFARLTEWHPPVGIALEIDAGLPARFHKAPYRIAGSTVRASTAGLAETAVLRLHWIRELLTATRDRAPNFSCFGMHEWAMVYRGLEVRHRDSTPLRLPQAEIDAFVESRPLCCSHFDAFRFFPPAARPLNRLQPDLDSRLRHEQPACIHANMDLYKWAGKAMPWVGSSLWLDCLELARELRDLDMRASPYDLRRYGLEAVAIETPAGRESYETEQRRLAAHATKVRQRLIDALAFLDDAPA